MGVAAANQTVVKNIKVDLDVVGFWAHGVHPVCVAEDKPGQHTRWVCGLGWDVNVEVKGLFVESHGNIVVPD